MTVRGVLRDGAIAVLAGTVISARIGAPERALATSTRRDDDGRAGTSGTVNELAREVVVWCDVSSVGRGAIARGDVVMVRRPLGSSIGAGRVAIQRVVRDESDGLARGRCELRASEAWRGRDDDGGGDVGEVPVGVIRGRIAAVLWPPSEVGAVGREAVDRATGEW